MNPNTLESKYILLHGEMFDKFTGLSLRPHIYPILELLSEFKCHTVLDYGCGNAACYAVDNVDRMVWGVNAYLYDPNHPVYNVWPKHDFDMVVCTDVLEHIPEECIPEVLLRILGKARRCVYLNVSTTEARKVLPNGENAHVTVRPLSWWQDKLDEALGERDLPVVLNGRRRA